MRGSTGQEDVGLPDGVSRWWNGRYHRSNRTPFGVKPGDRAGKVRRQRFTSPARLPGSNRSTGVSVAVSDDRSPGTGQQLVRPICQGWPT